MKTKTFIPIECDILNDNRMNALLNKSGAAGYGVYMLLLIELRNLKDYCLDGESLRFIARKYNIRRKLIDDVLYNYGLFTVDRMEDDNLLITSDYVTRVMQNYNDTVAKRSIVGKKNANKRWQKENGNAMATEHNITEKKTSVEKDKKETAAVAAVAADNPVTVNSACRWKDYLTEAVSDRTWIECQAMHSGLGVRFLQYEPVIVDLFAKHAITHGKSDQLSSVGEVKYYFANFTRSGTHTNKRIVAELNKLERMQKEENPYRFETIDPVSGRRTFQGIEIPASAPPRPNENVTWSTKLAKWV
ncbi:Lin1244/Lin1753 domain-containing protein [Bacteroides sp. 519]|uniref:DUF7833 domain-containing protein n=1 Tax=Bacteroides sp. 519 TaxID=2302937 RepID=UPI0013D304D9|nr:Lin1244/Lin1753 domain-containing protein [Bacteroides sp. 519]NDV59038.1 DUF4373 domain-containing protein [Bacteroides sp. 519]